MSTLVITFTLFTVIFSLLSPQWVRCIGIYRFIMYYCRLAGQWSSMLIGSVLVAGLTAGP
ncbi:hypothetical protein HD806DRAFT_490565 [Xylariaceae sp. AK1471]|nr:hypothetical protein HD806DRAFT_490565 [Xylariaceae sp. AK1471]